jgi:hypothetical protein
MLKSLSASGYTMLMTVGVVLILNLITVGPALANKIIGNG